MKRIRFAEMRLKKKLIVSLIAFVFMPIVLFSVLFLILIFNKEIHSLETIQTQENQKSVEKLESIMQYSDTIYSNVLYKYYINYFMYDKANMTQHYEVSQYFDDLLERYPYYVNFVVYNHQEIKYQRGIHLENITDNELKKSVLYDENSFFLKPHKMRVSSIYDSSDFEVISYIYKLKNYTSQGAHVYGMFEINFDPKKLYKDVFASIDTQDTDIYLISNMGEVFLASDTKKLGEKIEEYENLKLAINNEEGMFYCVFQGRPQLCYYQTLDNYSFYILRFVSVFDLVRSQLPILLIVFFMICVCIIFAVLFSNIQNKFMIAPLADISAELKKIERGNFSIHLAVNAKDEIGDLSSSVLQMSEKLESLIKENYIRKIKQQEAEMDVLVTQINPHFLYNTLDSIHWTAIKEKKHEISQQIEALSTMFRHILNKGENTILISKEIEFLESYFLIMNQSYKERIKFHVEIEEENTEELKRYKIPKLLIQPLIENCFIHGFKNPNKSGIIVVRFYNIDEYLYIEVEDNGSGIDSKKLSLDCEKNSSSGKYSALKNIFERIKLFYGQESKIYIKGKIGKGTCIIIKLPYKLNG